ncbi:MAG: YitT family protein [Bacteroidales bacterium]|nr:YitT family protein [Bacteroidales bacterium]
MSASKVRLLIQDYLVITLACFIFAWAWEGFMIPSNMSAGGMMGLSTIIQYATGGLIPAQYTYIGINALLIIIAVFAMGIGFGFKTIYAILMSTVAMQVIASVPFLQCTPEGFFYVKDTLLVPVIAGTLEATGLGLVIRFGGSTGGTDIVAIMINKYYPVQLSVVFMITDLITVALLLLLPGRTFTDMTYGVVEIVIFNLLIDDIVGGHKSTFQLLVFSEKYKEIADHIIKDMERGVTVLKAQGWYTKKEKNVLLILINRGEFSSLMKEIKALDPRAFMSVSTTKSVYGEGFEEIKGGMNDAKSLIKKGKKNES